MLLVLVVSFSLEKKFEIFTDGKQSEHFSSWKYKIQREKSFGHGHCHTVRKSHFENAWWQHTRAKEADADKFVCTL